MRVRILRNGIMNKNLPDLTGKEFLVLKDSPGSYYLELHGGPYYCSAGTLITCQFVKTEDVEVVSELSTPAATAYPDGNPKSLQGAKKYSLRYLPLSANIAVNQAFENGAHKYGAANWREKGVACTVYVDAALRHIFQYFDGGQQNASDSGVHNLAHAMACLAIIIDAEANGSLTDDRPFPTKDTDALLVRPGV